MTVKKPKAEHATAQIIAQMLEVNRGVVEALPATKWKIDDMPLIIGIEHHTFHWLSEVGEYVRDLDKRLQNWMNATGIENMDAVDGFPAHLKSKGVYVTGLDGEEKIKEAGSSTHDGNSLLSDDLYVNAFEIEGVGYAVIGVLSRNLIVGRPRVFRTPDEGTTIFDYGKADVMPVDDKDNRLIKGGVIWSTWDAGKSWEVADAGDYEAKPLDEYPFSADPKYRGKHYVYVDVENNKVYCPITGAELVPFYL